MADPIFDPIIENILHAEPICRSDRRSSLCPFEQNFQLTDQGLLFFYGSQLAMPHFFYLETHVGQYWTPFSLILVN